MDVPETLEFNAEELAVYKQAIAQFPDFDFADRYYLKLRCVRAFWTEKTRVKLAQEALVGLRTFRLENNLDDLVNTEMPCEREFNDLWPSYVFGFDRHGHVITGERVAEIEVEKLFDLPASMEDKVKLRLQQCETLETYKCHPLNSQQPALYKNVFILDLKDISMSRHFGAKPRKFIQTILKVGQSTYYEGAWKIFLINSPSLFRMVWDVAKGWLEERTRIKVHVLSGTPEKNVEYFAQHGIDRDQLPVWAGGSNQGRTVYDYTIDFRNERILNQILSQ
eukprot:c21536_g1_i1.p1 GENE.c21536_g1_i1~~c21536_g1_i1.p1  ORF type:complete len:287 (+),score=56.97 c21536_g1_i1:26-862(+)